MFFGCLEDERDQQHDQQNQKQRSETDVHETPFAAYAEGVPGGGRPTRHDAFVTAQGSAYMRSVERSDRGNVTEALSAASELDFVAS